MFYFFVYCCLFVKAFSVSLCFVRNAYKGQLLEFIMHKKLNISSPGEVRGGRCFPSLKVLPCQSSQNFYKQEVNGYIRFSWKHPVCFSFTRKKKGFLDFRVENRKSCQRNTRSRQYRLSLLICLTCALHLLFCCSQLFQTPLWNYCCSGFRSSYFASEGMMIVDDTRLLDNSNHSTIPSHM